MTYAEYLKMGFKRVDMHDAVHFDQTGNQSFVLEFEVNNDLHINAEVKGKPRMYYKHKFMCYLTMSQVEEIINRKYDLQ